LTLKIKNGKIVLVVMGDLGRMDILHKYTIEAQPKEGEVV